MSATLSEATKKALLGLHPSHRRVLEALLFAPDHSASAGQLKKLLGLSAIIQANAAMGHIGRRIQEILDAHPDGLAEGEYQWWHVVATGSSVEGKGFVWRLREEVVAGLLAFGYTEHGFQQPAEVKSEEVLIEGAVRQVLVNAYERNPVARARCLEAYGYKCIACNFDFGAAYGKDAEGFIHVHHIKPLAEVGGQYEVDPIEDLRPVCPNCHAVIHMVNPPRSIEQLKSMLYG